MRLFDTYDYIAGTEGIFCDVAGITRKYRYTGNGKWQEIGLEATIKYEEHQSSAFSSSDFSIGGFVLNKSIKTLEPSLSNFFADFTSEELNNGVLIDNDGLLIGATQGEITYISLEDGDNATKLGLKLSDTKEKAIELYGIPDKGFVNDSTWTYYIYREEWSEGNLSVYIDSLNLEFCKDKVCRIWMVSYIAAY
ncbi:MAG: hypothetical protein GX957_03495 [Clostridiaceae bacterium]|nr:hypothetical protein [Clostridiaceae bacterium]